MLTQILITVFVIVVVLLVTRMRKPVARGNMVRRPSLSGPRGGRSRAFSKPAIAGYSLVLVIAVGAMVLFYLQWVEANRVVTIQVVDTRSGETVTYHAFKKEISGRNFRTVDGRNVSLGDSDRMELIDTH